MSNCLNYKCREAKKETNSKICKCCIDSVHDEIDTFFHFFLVSQLHYLVVEPGSPPLLH